MRLFLALLSVPLWAAQVPSIYSDASATASSLAVTAPPCSTASSGTVPTESSCAAEIPTAVARVSVFANYDFISMDVFGNSVFSSDITKIGGYRGFVEAGMTDSVTVYGRSGPGQIEIAFDGAQGAPSFTFGVPYVFSNYISGDTAGGNGEDGTGYTIQRYFMGIFVRDAQGNPITSGLQYVSASGTHYLFDAATYGAPTQAPEPASWLLLAAGLALLNVSGMRRRFQRLPI